MRNLIAKKFGFFITKNHLSQFSWLAGGQLIALLLGLFSIKLLTSIGPAEYGYFILVTSIGGLLSMSFFGPLEQGFVRFYFECTTSDKEKSNYLNFILYLLFLSGIALVIISLFAVVIGIFFFHQSLLFMASGCCLIVLSVLSPPITGILNAMKLRRELSVVQVLEKLFIVLFLFGAFFTVTMNSTSVMFSIASSMVIFFFVRVFFLKRESTLPVTKIELLEMKKTLLPKIFSYILPFFLWGWISWFQFNGERWVINSFLPSSEVGRYGLALSVINNSIVVLYGVYIQFITPLVFEKYGSPNADQKKKGKSLIFISSFATLGLFVVFGIFLFFFGKEIIQFLSTKDFELPTSLLLYLVIGFGLFYVGQTMALVGMAMQKPNIYIFPKVLTAIISVGGYIIGCQYFGIWGIAYSIIIANTFYVVSIFIANKKLQTSNV